MLTCRLCANATNSNKALVPSRSASKCVDRLLEKKLKFRGVFLT